MNDNHSEPSKPLGYREQTYSDFVRAWVNAKKEEQRRHQEELEAERQREQAKLALQERAREIERAREVERTREVERMREIERIRLHEADVPTRVIEAQDLLVPQLAHFEAELAEPPFLQLREAREATELDPWRRRGDLHWSVYVVLLSRFIRGDSGGRPGRPDMPYVYVGQTWHDPEHRFKQHKELVPGYPSRHVRDYGIALLPEVYGFNNPVKYVDPSGHCATNYEIGSADMDTCLAAWNAVVNYIDGVVFGPGGSGDFPDAGINDWLLNADIAMLERLMKAWGIDYGYTWTPPAGHVTSGRRSRRNLKSPEAMAEVCHYWQSCFEPVVTGEEMKPDAIAGGVSGSAAGVVYGVVGGELVYNLDTKEKSLFTYTGQGAGVALEGDVSGYGALIWNLDKNVDYEGVSPTLTVDLGAGVHGQLSLFWEAGTIPFTGDTWGVSLGPGGGGGFGLTGSFADYTCQAGCR